MADCAHAVMGLADALGWERFGAGRAISAEHFGMSIGYARAPIDPATARAMTARRPRSVELTPVGLRSTPPPACREGKKHAWIDA